MFAIPLSNICIYLQLCSITMAVTELNIGVILIQNAEFPYGVEHAAAAIDIAVEKVNNQNLNGTYKLVPRLRKYGPKCDANEAPGIVADMHYEENIVALIGPGCTYALDPVARLAAFWNIPIITGLGDSGRFKDKTDFKTLTRMAYCQCRLRKVFGSIFRQFDWEDIMLIMDRDQVHGLIVGETLEIGLKKGGYFPHSIKYYGQKKPDLRDILYQASRLSRVIVLSVSGDSVRDFMLAAYDAGYTQSGEYVFLDVELFKFPGVYWGDHSWRRGDANDTKARKAYEALLRIALHEPTGTLFQEFASEVIHRAKQDYGFDYKDEKVNFFTGAYHDGILLYGLALNETLQQHADYTDGYNLSRRMWNRSFTGITDGVFIDDNGDRDTSYAILDMLPESGEFIVVAHYWGNNPGYTPVPGVAIQWPGSSDQPPLNVPFCGFENNNPDCAVKKPLSTLVIALIAVLCVVIIAGVLTLYSYRKYKLEGQIRDTSWIIREEDVHRRRSDLYSVHSLVKFASGSITSKSTGGKSGPEEKRQVFTDVASYKGNMVALRTLSSETRITLSRNLLREVYERRTMNHENIVRFVGAVLGPEKKWLLHEYCQKGSLQDLLANESVDLDRVFKMSLIGDIIQGMRFIHTSDVHFHGRLSSTNCVVDGRFVLKICDFGLPSFYKAEETADKDQCRKLQWYSPERLREPSSVGSQADDVYAFGIILCEIVTRGEPYESYTTTFEFQDVIEKVKAGLTPPFRPEIAPGMYPAEIERLMSACWRETAERRPDFIQINNTYKELTKGKSKNILDDLMNRMEQYAKNLESIVAERTSMLIQEQRKTDQLLLQILPRSVADELKHGKTVHPETFESVTIYFSDVVGFTNLSSSSTPLQIVNFLNDMYTLFDEVIDEFDVYKVETIGDAYMVVSGLPIRNEHFHAQEIARMSLKLLQVVDKFRVRHRPDYSLKLRIGLHSGSVVAGVVGLKMPRYCLFGDTVNTASRMESTGEAMKIHMSDSTKLKLEMSGSFNIEERGEIDVKGKGTMKTYWLLGEKS